MDAIGGQGKSGGEVFRAVLTPHRSLGPVGFLVLMTALSLVSFTVGLVFFLSGAWPVLGFCGLDLLIIYIAFKLNYRSGRLREMIDVTPDELVLTRIHPSGRSERFDFNPYWARVRLDEPPGGGTVLQIASHGKKLAFGRFLTDEEKRDLAEVLEQALLAARGGVRI